MILKIKIQENKLKKKTKLNTLFKNHLFSFKIDYKNKIYIKSAYLLLIEKIKN